MEELQEHKTKYPRFSVGIKEETRQKLRQLKVSKNYRSMDQLINREIDFNHKEVKEDARRRMEN